MTSKSDVSDLSVVVPVHNAASTVGDLVRALLATPDLHVQVILVDDHSSDDSPEVVRSLAEDDRVLAIQHDKNLGAGVARNTGFRAAVGRYCLFFDADDDVHTDAVGEAVRGLDDTGADLALLPYHYRRGMLPGHTGMNAYDQETWDEYLGSAPRRLGTLDELPRLLGFSNYPWNKILRTETYRRAGLQFGSTQVHNDILGHWYSVLFARSILLLDRAICTHVVEAAGGNLTNRHTAVRLTLFDALDETYDLLEGNPGLRRRYAHHYWAFVIRVTGWAGDRVDPSHRDEFKLRLQDHLLRANLSDYSRIRMKRDPRLADQIVRKAVS